MNKAETLQYLSKRFNELIFENVEVSEKIKIEVMDYYLSKLSYRCENLFKGKDEIDKDTLTIFIAHCLSFDDAFKGKADERWKKLYAEITREKIDDYDRKIEFWATKLEKENKIDLTDNEKALFDEIRNYFSENKDFIYENGGKEFFDEKEKEIFADINYLEGSQDKRSERRPKYL